MNLDNANQEFFAAFVAAQGQMHGAKKTGSNTYLNTQYMTVDDVIFGIKKALNDNGLAFSQTCYVENGHFHCQTYVIHTGHGYASWYTQYPIGKTDIQSLGSYQTYVRRYSLMAIFAIAEADDDGQKAMQMIQLPDYIESMCRYLSDGELSAAAAIWYPMDAQEKRTYFPQLPESAKGVLKSADFAKLKPKDEK